jgi:peptidoglycan/xylan/chitin deacetylase (PgdA/CDA1 family)
MFLSMKRDYTSLYRIIVGAIFVCALFLSLPATAAIPEDKSAAVIFMYQRIGEDIVPQGNISVEQFKAHINELRKGGYSILPLAKIIEAAKNGDPLPPKTVAITFDGAYQGTLAIAVPLLAEAQMPFTIFFATDALDNDTYGHITWDQIRKLGKNGLTTFGILPASYEHMVNQTPEQNAALVNRAVSRYREMLGEEPVFFAYPYGEISGSLKKQIAGYKFKAAFGQQSGVVYNGSDFNALPRFTMTDDYGDFDRFMLTAHALPLPMSDIVPEDKVIEQNPPLIGFTVSSEIHNIDKLACFASGIEGKLPLTRLDGTRIEIRPPKAFIDRRTRINCTLPNEAFTPGETPNWRWFGMLLTLATLDEDSTMDSPNGGSDIPPNSYDSPDSETGN